MSQKSVTYFERFYHSICIFIFNQCLIKFRYGYEKENSVDRVLKTLKPLLSLRSLASDVDESKWHFFDGHFGFGDDIGSSTRP